MTRPLLLLCAFLGTCLSERVTLDEDCVRVRRPVHELDHTELMLYVEGLQQIRANGKFQIMIDAHHENTAIHRGSSFFFYHTYYVWEVESQIRKIGGKFACFSVPYYDWTIDAGHEDDPWILNSVFGGDGNPGNHNCVKGTSGATGSKNWGPDLWPLNELCNAVENPDACCLKRNLMPEVDLGTAQETGELVERVEFSGFEGGCAFYHQKVHWLFGLGDECVSCAMATGYSPDDPIFMLLHSYTAFLRAVWAACHGYDRIAGHELDGHEEAYKAECAEGFFDGDCGVVELDDVYDFGDMPKYGWSLTSQVEVTPRSMWDFSDWNTVYDMSDFLERTGLEHSAVCDVANFEKSKWLTKVVELEKKAAPAKPAQPAQPAEGKPDAKEAGPKGRRNGKHREEQEVMAVQRGVMGAEVDSQMVMAGMSVVVFMAGVALCVANRGERKNVEVVKTMEAGYGAV